MAMQSDKEVAKERFYSLKEDTSKVKELSTNELYSVKLNSGVLIISSEKFEDMSLKNELLRGMYRIGLEKPSFIQSVAMPQILKGNNSAFHSKSGTGKTITFTTGSLQKLTPGCGQQVIILAPTRELCIQIGGVVKKLAEFIFATVCVALRTFFSESVPEDIVKARPGKILGLISSKVLDTKHISLLILDEADCEVAKKSSSRKAFFSFSKSLFRA